MAGTCGLLFRWNVQLRNALASAAEQLRMQEKVSQSAEASISSVKGREDELREERKRLEERLDAASCNTGSAYIDSLMELLGDDHQKRCR